MHSFRFELGQFYFFLFVFVFLFSLLDDDAFDSSAEFASAIGHFQIRLSTRRRRRGPRLFIRLRNSDDDCDDRVLSRDGRVLDRDVRERRIAPKYRRDVRVQRERRRRRFCRPSSLSKTSILYNISSNFVVVVVSAVLHASTQKATHAERKKERRENTGVHAFKGCKVREQRRLLNTTDRTMIYVKCTNGGVKF